MGKHGRKKARAAHAQPKSHDGRSMRLRYAAAKTGRLIGDWFPVGQDVNALISQASPIVRSRMRQLVRDFPPFARAVNVLVKFTVGTGVQFQSHVLTQNGDPDREARAGVEEFWRVFCDEADASASPSLRMSLHEMAALAKRQEEDQGEFLCMFQPRAERNAYLPFGLAFYESERLSSLGASPSAGRDVLDGVEFDKRTGAITGFYIEEDGYTRRVTRVPAEQCVFGLDRKRVGQMRGITPFAPAMLLAHSLRTMMEAEIDAAKLASKWLAVVKTPNPEGFQGERDVQTVDGRRVEELENAIIEYLEPGEEIEIKSHNRGGETFQAFCKFILRLIAITRDLPYDLLSGDTSDVNYSSLRVSRNDFIQALAPDQQRVISQFYRPVFRKALGEAVLHGRVRLPGYWSDPWRFERALWIPPGMKPVDPLREFKAKVEAIKAGLISPQQAIMEMGGDPERTLAEIAAWNAMCAEYGLDFSASMSGVSTAGANNPAALDGEDADRSGRGKLLRVK